MSVEPPAGSYVPASRYGTLQRLAALAGWFPAAVVTVAALGLGAAGVQPGLGFWDTGSSRRSARSWAPPIRPASRPT